MQQKSSREGYEFSDTTKLEALKRSDWCCEVCGIPKEECEMLYLHHVLPIAIARQFYPYIVPELVKSLENCRVVCYKCHQIEDKESRRNHRTIAQALLFVNQLHARTA